MKNTKIAVILTGITALVFGAFSANKTEFQKMISQKVRVTTVALVPDCETPPSKTKNG